MPTAIAPAPTADNPYPNWVGNGLNPNIGGASSAPDTSGVSSGNSNNPIISSTGTRADVTSLGSQIDSLTNTGTANANLDNGALANLKSDYEAQISNLKTQNDSAMTALKSTQGGQYASRAAGLVTSGGGFLGTTQSHAGVLESLKQNQEAEISSLQAKQDASVQAAKSAYDSKNFELASKLVKDANDTNIAIQKAKDDYATQQLNLTKEAQSELEYQTGQTEKIATSLSALTPADYAKIPQSQKDKVDAVYYPGYMDALNKTAQIAAAVKTQKDQQAVDAQILDMRLKMPAGKSFTLGGQTYTGLDTGPKPTQTEVTANIHNQLQTGILSGETIPGSKDPVSGAPLQKYTVPGTNGIPFIDKDGNVTPEGFKAAYQIAGLSRKDFIQTYGYLIPQSESSKDRTWAKYGLSPAESKLLTSVVPADTAP